MRQVPEINSKPDGHSGQRGAVLVEMAFTLPIMALIFLIIIDGGLAIREHQLLQNAAREGARYATQWQGAAEVDIKRRVVEYCAEEHITVALDAVNVAPYDIPIGPNQSARGTSVTVSYTRQNLFLGPPLVPSSSMTLTGRAIFRNLF